MALAAALIFTPAALAQGITTAGISGVVTDDTGSPVSGASVSIVHEPSGTRASAVTRTNGQFSASGLRVGGPYTVTATSTGYSTETRSDIYLEVGASTPVPFTLNAEGVRMEAFRVEAERDLTFGAGQMGSTTNFNSNSISNTPTVRNSVQDIARLDSRLFLGSLDQGGQLSAQGQNFRFNSFLIDGVSAGDPFGLNSNGFGSLGSPVPLEALEAVSVQLSPYDVRYGGFTGALINAIIKSGTNRYRGSLYYQFTNEDLRAKNPVSGAKEAFDDKNYGITFSGPILKNILFFSLSYDKKERETVAPQPNFVPDANGVAAIAAITSRLQAQGYEAGSLEGPDTNLTEQESWIGKLDWNISPDHRLSATYRRDYGSFTNFANYTGGTNTSLSNHWFDQPRNTDSYTAQLNSQWTPDFRSEATVSYTEYDGTPSNRGAAFPMVRVNGITGTRLDTGAALTTGLAGGVFFGTENSRQLNLLTTKETQVKLNGEYTWGNHTFTFGGEEISTKYNNAFVQNTMGNYIFASPATFLAGGPPSSFQLQKPYAGFSIEDAIARWRYDALAGFIQDTWRPNSRLTVLAGLRYDYPHIPKSPPAAANFATAGFTTEGGRAVTRNDTTNDGNATLAPRIGASYEIDAERPTQIRGGVGLFQGRNPAVWISNAYNNAGAVYNYTASSTELAQIRFNPDPDTQTVPGTSNPPPNINITDPSFKQPSLWKSNIAIDHELPFGGIVASAEFYYNWTENAVQYEFLNYRRATDGNGSGLAPDGRQRFGTAASIVNSSQAQAGTPGRRRVAQFADVIYLTNSDKGLSKGLTLSLARPLRNNWAWSASYTRADATEVSPITSSTASSNYSNRAVFNPNENVASTSNTSLRNNVVITATRRFEFIQKAPTTLSLIYQGRTGRPYSWVFYGDANGDGYTFNDLFYVPSGPNDPRVTWASAEQRDAFFAFVDASSLKNYRGTNAPRNSETSPWIQTFDLKITQELPVYRGVKAELFANILNFANLFDKSWGIQEEVPFSYRRAVAGATYNAAGNNGQGAWAYAFTSTTLNGVPVTVDDTPVSRWQVQLGMRLSF